MRCIAGQGLELFETAVGLIGHEVLKIETNFLDGLGDLGIAQTIRFDGIRLPQPELRPSTESEFSHSEARSELASEEGSDASEEA